MKHLNGLWVTLLIIIAAAIGSYFWVGMDFFLLVVPLAVILGIVQIPALQKQPVVVRVIVVLGLLCLFAAWAGFVATGGATMFEG